MRLLFLLTFLSVLTTSSAFATKLDYCIRFDLVPSSTDTPIASATCSVNQNFTDIDFSSRWDCDFANEEAEFFESVSLPADGIGFDFKYGTYFAQYFITPSRGLGRFFFDNLGVPSSSLNGNKRFEVYFFATHPVAPESKLTFDANEGAYTLKFKPIAYDICQKP
ncbi:MAG: hypothetical protein AB7T49_16890 [Oligoflexales bacterium]